MDTFRTLVGWLLFLAMAVVAGFFWHQSAERGAHIALLSNTISQMESQINQLSENIDILEEQITGAMKTIIDMKKELEASQGTELYFTPNEREDSVTQDDKHEVADPPHQVDSTELSDGKEE